MSDFDAEAERKRLREKYEAEAESREQTQQMSELLLKGATMTNRHCGECGSPIFQYEDREFCPNCQRAAGADAAGEAGTDGDESDAPDAAAAAGTDGDESDAPDAAAAGETARPEAEASTADTGADAEATAPGTGGAAASNGTGTADDATESGRDRDVGRAVAGESAAGDRPDTTTEPAKSGRAAPTRQAARESLLAALTRHAGLAADTDEPRRATDHLAAAREAAAALNELDGS